MNLNFIELEKKKVETLSYLFKPFLFAAEIGVEEVIHLVRTYMLPCQCFPILCEKNRGLLPDSGSRLKSGNLLLQGTNHLSRAGWRDVFYTRFFDGGDNVQKTSIAQLRNAYRLSVDRTGQAAYIDFVLSFL